MAQNDFIIADQSASAALSDINSALQSLASCSSGSTEPSVKYANQLWYDTSTNILKVRNEANSAWISIVYVHQADGAVHILDNTYISDTSGNHVGLLGDQATSEWTTGTGTTESLVSPAKVFAATNSVLSTSLMGYIASVSVGAVGSYAFMRNSVKENLYEGTTRSGSQLRYTCHEAIADGIFGSHGATLGTRSASGTWRLMGYNNHRYSESDAKAASLWLRIS